MVHHIISVCIFCFICATHTPCASHAAVGHFDKRLYDGYKDPNILEIENNPELHLREKLLVKRETDSYFNADQITSQDNDKNILKRNIGNQNTSGDSDFLKKIFMMFGDGNSMTVEEFRVLLRRLDLLQILSKRLSLHEGEEDTLCHTDMRKEVAAVQNDTCFTKETLSVLQEPAHASVNHTTFSEVCPILIYGLLAGTCSINEKDTFEVLAPVPHGIDGKRWLYSSLAVLLISVCGVGALIIIPLMRKRFYKPLIQFLVALAVGTLAGDALLHLLPHAMGVGHGHDSHSEEGGTDPHLENTWKGLVAMMGLTFFFIMERLILVAGKWRKQQQKHKTVPHAHVQIFDDQGERRTSTQCMDKYNTSPYCYKDIIEPNSKSDLQMKNSQSRPLDKIETNRNVYGSKISPNSCLIGRMPPHDHDTDSIPTACAEAKMLPHDHETDLIPTACIEAKMLPHDHEDMMVIVREHESDHHGHSHKHGHVHAAPQNYSSVAWMVIMGDGLHNFTDGMAIGAAFASGIAGGFSTTVAVFCHELPHELGDFAMLLKAGMSIKQALFYNLLSSGLCVLGNFVGLYLGNTETANQWVFAAAAGTFIYIALVDMIPELSSAHDDEENLFQSLLHLSGLLIGVGIMTVIALYEHDLKDLFHDPE